MKNLNIVNIISIKIIKTALLSAISLVLSMNSMVHGQDAVIVKDLSVSFYSDIFQEKREVKIQHIYLEKDSLMQNIPTLLVLDADMLFNLTFSTVEFLEMSQEFPPILLIGLSNTNRQEELVGGSANEFAKFIEEEVDSILTEVFPNRGTLSVIGHSNSADFILKNHVEDIASACVLSGVTDNFTFIDKDFTNYFCYSGSEDYKHRLGFVKKLDSLKQSASSKASNVTTEIFKDRSHYDVPMSGIGSYIKSYFRQYVSLSERELSFIQSSENKLEGIITVINDKKQTLQISYTPSTEDVSIFSEIVDATQFESVFKFMLSLNLDATTLLFTHYFLGDFYEENNRYEEALTQYELMYNSAPDWVSNKDQLHENIDRIKENISDNEEK